ncbi:MAG: hypothetical protein WAN50_00310 [Minisyncoccia bacterium]
MNYLRIQKSIAATVAANGEIVTWSQTAATVDPDKPWNGVGGAKTSSQVNCFFYTSGSSVVSALLHVMGRTDVPQLANQAIVPVIAGFTPQIADAITRGNESLVVTAVDTVGPLPTPACYIVTFNKG